MIRPVFTELALFLAPFVIYAIYLVATKAALLTLASWPPKVLATLGICALDPDDRQLRLSVAFLRLAAGLDLRAGPCRGRQVRSGAGGAVSEPLRSLARRRVAARRARWRGCSQVLDRDGEEARVVGGAVRNALLGEPISEFDIATTAVPQEVIRRATAAGFKPVPTGIEHGTITVVIDEPAVRSHDAARGRRDLRPPRQCALRPRLAGRRRAARLHHECAVGRRRRRRARLCRRHCRPRSAARALHRRCRKNASPRIICASCASSASTPPMATGCPMPRGLPPASPRAPGSRNCRASGCGWNCSSCCWRGTRRRRSRSMAESGLARCRCWAAFPTSRASRTWPRSRRPPACRRMRCSGSARSARAFRRMPSGCGSGCASPTPSTSGLPRWPRHGGGFRRPTRRRPARCSTGSGRERFVDRVLIAWARSGTLVQGRARRSLARAWRRCPSIGPRRCFRSRPPISSSAA